jgi:hypothetical protein
VDGNEERVADTSRHRSKEDFGAALATKDKYVLIYLYQGEVNPQAEE